MQWHSTAVLLPGKSHGQRSLVGCSPWGHKESDMTERLHFHFSLSCIGEGNGNPLQCSCLENPRDGGAWWAAVYGVAQSRTRLKRLSSSSSSILCPWDFPCKNIGVVCHFLLQGIFLTRGSNLNLYWASIKENGALTEEEKARCRTVRATRYEWCFRRQAPTDTSV